MAFNVTPYLIKVQGNRDYLPVSARILWFRQEHPDWSIETEFVEINHEKQYAICRTRICDGDGKLMATATKKEDVKGFGDYIEKCETGSLGRALGFCGYSTEGDPSFDDGQAGPQPPRSQYPSEPQRPPVRPADNRTANNRPTDDRPSPSAPPRGDSGHGGGEVGECFACHKPVRIEPPTEPGGKPERYNQDGGKHFLTCKKGLPTGYESDGVLE